MSLKLLLVAALALATSPALAQQAKSAAGIVEGKVVGGVRVVEMAVTENGFEPSKVKVKKGEKVRLVITRKTERTCATEIVVQEHGINTPLPLGKAVDVELTPKKSGEIHYACGMGHIRGILFVP
jgi:plastocyanin domain-containing protein